MARAWHSELPSTACEIITQGRVPKGAKLVPLSSDVGTPTSKERRVFHNKPSTMSHGFESHVHSHHQRFEPYMIHTHGFGSRPHTRRTFPRTTCGCVCCAKSILTRYPDWIWVSIFDFGGGAKDLGKHYELKEPKIELWLFQSSQCPRCHPAFSSATACFDWIPTCAVIC